MIVKMINITLEELLQIIEPKQYLKILVNTVENIYLSFYASRIYITINL